MAVIESALRAPASFRLLAGLSEVLLGGGRV